MSTPMFEIENPHVTIEDREVLKGVNLTVNTGEIHALMDPKDPAKARWPMSSRATLRMK